MDVEKTIEFLLENQAALQATQAAANERLTRIEKVVVVLIDRTNHLDEVMAKLAESQIKLSDRLDLFAQQSAEGDKRLGERIEALVSARGEVLRNRPLAS